MTDERTSLFSARYRVPRSQVWEGSRGRQSGHVHLYVKPFQQFDAGRIHRSSGPETTWSGRRPDRFMAVCLVCVEVPL